jgi:hypothetical protein
MINATFDIKDFSKVMENVVEYTDGFLRESTARADLIAKKISNASIQEFYRYLDSLANANPSMLHHVYEWGATGNPGQRLFELKASLYGKKSKIEANFLTSLSVSDGSSEPFFEKARIMEEGIPIVVNEVSAKALFFEIDGEEFFRTGPIIIPNPGGEAVRGQFKAQFEEFYNVYLTQFYLRAIRFYDHFSNPKDFSQNFGRVSKGGGARAAGKQSALSWIMKAPGDD